MCSMAQEDHTLRCNNSSRLSKKSKKVPQRGMGVAQLEKLILEEKQKKDVVLTPNSTNFRLPVIPLPPPLPPNNRPLITRSEAISGVFVSKPMNSGSGGGNNFSRLWTCGENPNPNQNRTLDHRGYAVTMPTNLGSLPYESNTLVWPPVPRSHCQQPSTSCMANVSLGTTSTSSSSVIMSFQMEPPSNQSYYGNKYSPLWPDEQKMVGMKRSYQYLVDNVPIPSFNCQFPSAYLSPITRFDESTSCSNGGTTSLEPMVPNFREKPRSQGTIADQKTKKLIENNCDPTKDFLTLAPPRASPQSHSSSKAKVQSLSGQTKDPSGVKWSNHHQLHSFFMAAKTNGNNNEEAVEHVDLSLKL